MSVVEHIRGGLVVSCQAYGDEPMNRPEVMAAVAQSAVRGGACAIRARGVADLEAVREAVDVPVIGLDKFGDHGVFITPTLENALMIAATGCEVVALDGTGRPRPDGLSLAETVAGLKQRFPTTLVMADCATTEEARAAVEAGADLVGTTLAGYTQDRAMTDGPDLAVLAEICASVGIPVIAEGRYATAEHVRQALGHGAHAVCVGSAITHPERITRALLAELTSGPA